MRKIKKSSLKKDLTLPKPILSHVLNMVDARNIAEIITEIIKENIESVVTIGKKTIMNRKGCAVYFL